jgi:T5SS/PEP-CTERM-associated repeat protein/autotransporter-associated beta strand protein
MSGKFNLQFVSVSKRSMYFYSICAVLWTTAILIYSTSHTHAAIVGTGDLNPVDPATWSSTNDSFVGLNSTGTLTIDSGSVLTCDYTTLGYAANAAGTVTVTGIGSKWSNQELNIGHNGSGTLNIQAGGLVDCFAYAYLGNYAGSTGSATVAGAGSKWTINTELFVGHYGSGTLTVTDGGTVIIGKGLYASLSHLAGNGTITSNGAVLDADLRFDSAHGLQQTLAFGTGGSLNLDQSASKTKSPSVLGAGYHGTGTLTIAEGIAVISSNGYLGYHAGSDGTATVTGNGSQWVCNGLLYVGNKGSGTLNVEAGGQVNSTSSYLGYSLGSSGTATVSGTGSKWTVSGALYVGRDGSGDLTVSNGGEVAIANGLYASLNHISGNGTISANGAVLDADLHFDSTHGLQQTLAFGSGGSLNLNQQAGSDLGVGYQDSGTLTIADGLAVASRNGYLGYHAGPTGSATVTGAGSTWTNQYELRIGNEGNGILRIEAGGKVSNNTGYIAYGQGSTGAVTVTGAGSLWNNSDLYIGRSGNGSLLVESGGQVNSYGGQLASGDGAIGTATITGAGSKWTCTSDLYIGSLGNGSLTVANGGEVAAKTLFASLSDLHGDGVISVRGAVIDAALVFDSTHGNSKTISFGTGGTLNLNLAPGGSLGVGNKGDGSLSISEGVTVASDAGYLGYSDGSTGIATVSGTGSKWTNAGLLRIGIRGNGILRIEAGGEVSNSSSNIGNTRNSNSTSSVTVTGPASKWTNTGTLTMSSFCDCSLRIEDGAQVSNTDGSIGTGTHFTSTATVTGANSIWTNSGTLSVGSYGNGSLRVEDGGQVTCVNSDLGRYSNSSGSATVAGTGSKWTISNSLYVGSEGNGTLTVSDGGLVATKMLFASVGNLLGNGTINAQSAVLDTDLVFFDSGTTQKSIPFGQGGMLTVSFGTSSTLGVGYKNSGTLRFANGGTTTSVTGYLGYLAGSNGSATISGANSKWSTNTLYVGYSGTGTLRIEEGAQTGNGTTVLGYNANSIGIATITGAGSKWSNGGSLYVGYSGSGTLNIEAGGQVSYYDNYIGYNANSSGNATVTGANSLWTNNGAIIVGYSGRGNLLVQNAGQATCYDGFLGYMNGSYGAATVAGAGSKWTLQNYLSVGYGSDGDLRVEGGGQVSNLLGHLGCGSFYQEQTNKSNNTGTATITGAGSLWTNRGDLIVGFASNGILRIEEGGQTTSVNGVVGYLPNESNATGAATITGTGSKWTMSGDLYVGNSMNGSIRIENGGEVRNMIGNLGYTPGFTGDAVVTGTNSKWTNIGNLNIGNTGSGTLNIDGGGQVSDLTAYLGNNAGSVGSAIVSGTNSKWSHSSNLYVGNYGNGSLSIDAGGYVYDTNCMMGFARNTIGIVTVSGAASKWENRNAITIGANGTGTLNLSGGTVIASGIQFAPTIFGVGTCNIDNGATLQVGSMSKGGGIANFNWNDGTIHNFNPATNLAISNMMVLKLAATGTHAFDIDSNRTGTVSGILADATSGGSLKKIGLGTLLLAGANTYSGTTEIEAGQFKVTGSILNTSGISVGQAGTLELAKSTGSATATNLTIDNEGMILISSGSQNVGSIIGTGITQVNAGATLTAQSIVQNTLTIGGAGVGSSTMSQVPEPGILVLFLSGILGMIVFSSRRNRSR